MKKLRCPETPEERALLTSNTLIEYLLGGFLTLEIHNHDLLNPFILAVQSFTTYE